MRNSSNDISGSYLKGLFLNIYQRLEMSGYILEPSGCEYVVNPHVPVWCQQYKIKGYRVSPESVFNLRYDAPNLFVTLYTHVHNSIRYTGIEARVEEPRNKDMIVYAYELDTTDTMTGPIDDFIEHAAKNLFESFRLYGYTDYISETSSGNV